MTDPKQLPTRAELEAIIDAPCPVRSAYLGKDAAHADPDDSGQCLYCACVLDILPDDYRDE